MKTLQIILISPDYICYPFSFFQEKSAHLDYMKNRQIRKHTSPIILLVLLAVLLSLPAIHYGYLLEDYRYLRPYSPEEILHTFSAHWEPLQIETKGYRPLHSVQYAFFYMLIGGDPVKNHILKMALFVAGVLLVYFLAFRCTNDISSAFWTALIYPCLATMAWQVSWLVNRQHLLQIIFFASMIILYDRYLLKGSRLFWTASLVVFLLALLLKETAVMYPLIILAFSSIVRKRAIRSQVKPLIPFFALLVIFIIVRSLILKDLPKSNTFPPPPDLHPFSLIYEYSRSLLGTCIQTQGIHDLLNDFPIYDLGLRTTRDFVSLGAVAGIFIIGGFLLFRRGSRTNKQGFILGLAILLLANIIVAAWYRTNRIFITSIGISLMIGVLVSQLFKSLTVMRKGIETTFVILVILFFGLYLTLNLLVFFEIQSALRPNGFLSLTWDRWEYEEYLQVKEKKHSGTITGEQLEIFKKKLRRSGRKKWAKQLP